MPPLTKDQLKIKTYILAHLSLAHASLSAEYYYDSLPLCVIDSVFSIGARYTSTRRTVQDFCTAFIPHKGRVSPPPAIQSDAYTISQFLHDVGGLPNYGASNLYHNKQRTSTKGGILKAEAVYRFAKALQEEKIERLADVRDASPAQLLRIEEKVREIPGQKSGISFSYFLMLSGNDNHMKIDRWLLRFVEIASGSRKTVPDAYSDLLAVCTDLKAIFPNLTPRLLDHEIWSFMK